MEKNYKIKIEGRHDKIKTEGRNDKMKMKEEMTRWK